MLRLAHIDEIDDNDSTHIAKTQLASDFISSTKVNFEGIAFLVGIALSAVTGIHVDNMKSLGVLDDDVGARFKRNSLTERRFNLLGDVETVENGFVLFIQFHNVFSFWSNKAHIVVELLEQLGVVNMDTFERRAEDVANDPQGTVVFFVD